ncbi:hypothetical protein ZWY2020_055205 [Hordeum vulgare]|nr:hypothetical protein ZWY2020_055205 [Hordeum vulgare]
MASPECALPNHVPTHSQASLSPGLPNFSQLPHIRATASPGLTPSSPSADQALQRRATQHPPTGEDKLGELLKAPCSYFIRCSNESVRLSCA